MTPDAALAQIRAHGDAERAAGAKAYHKSRRNHLGVPNPVLNDLTKTWRQQLDVDTRVALARGLWDSDIFEGRLAAAK
ncbi:MAG: DNA alkylation repair protein, partial [Pseudomonadota bacterium]